MPCSQIFEVGISEQWDHHVRQSVDTADQRMNSPDDRVPSDTRVPHRRYNDARGERFWTGCVSRSATSEWSFYFALQTSDICFDDLVSYDNKCFISENNLLRRKFLKEWIQLTDSATCLAYDEHDNVVGYGCRIPEKDVEDHFLVGPLYANDSQVASMILSKLCSDVPGKFIDIITR